MLPAFDASFVFQLQQRRRRMDRKLRGSYCCIIIIYSRSVQQAPVHSLINKECLVLSFCIGFHIPGRGGLPDEQGRRC